MVRKLSLFAPLIILTLSGAAQADSYFREQTKNLPNSGHKHAFCERLEGSQKVQGENINGLVKIASVSKLATSYWAIKALGANYRYVTKLYFNTQSRELHIEGSRDPVFGRNRMYLMLSELNRLGITEVSRVTYDPNFKVFIDVEDSIRSGLGVNGGVSESVTKDNLSLFLNTNRWDTMSRYAGARNSASDQGLEMLPSVEFSAPRIEMEKTAPFSIHGPVVAWEYASVPLHQILKFMNVESHNYLADEIFNGLGGMKAFSSFIEEEFGFDKDQIRMYTGSGLPLYEGQKRFDNEATCLCIIEIMEKMSLHLREEAGLSLPDVMLVTGVDRGTLKRYDDQEFDRSMVAKTGTINYSISMAGQVYTEDGRIYYGIYLQVPSSSFWGRAWAIRDKLIKQFLRLHGGSRPIKHTKRPEFFPVDSESRFYEFDQRKGELS